MKTYPKFLAAETRAASSGDWALYVKEPVTRVRTSLHAVPCVVSGYTLSTSSPDSLEGRTVWQRARVLKNSSQPYSLNCVFESIKVHTFYHHTGTHHTLCIVHTYSASNKQTSNYLISSSAFIDHLLVVKHKFWISIRIPGCQITRFRSLQ